jgi:hypothetical protein
MADKRNATGTEDLRETFFGILAFDVLVALERVEAQDTQTARRDLIRTLFAAIEGFVWEFRAHVREIADAVDDIPPLLAMALNETSYSVSENGKLVEQQRYIALPSMVRLATNLAQTLCQDLKVDFSVDGWADLKRTIALRNRITHPKSKADLNITTDDTTIAWSGFRWILGHVAHVMETTIAAQADYLRQFKILAERLEAGDPVAIEAYRASRAALYG